MHVLDLVASRGIEESIAEDDGSFFFGGRSPILRVDLKRSEAEP